MAVSYRDIMIGVLLASVAASGWSGPASAVQRKCQTLTTCNFSKNGSYRGCLSSYSCRQCRFVSSRCSIGGTSGRCQKMVCDWGG